MGLPVSHHLADVTRTHNSGHTYTTHRCEYPWTWDVKDVIHYWPWYYPFNCKIGAMPWRCKICAVGTHPKFEDSGAMSLRCKICTVGYTPKGWGHLCHACRVCVNLTPLFCMGDSGPAYLRLRRNLSSLFSSANICTWSTTTMHIQYPNQEEPSDLDEHLRWTQTAARLQMHQHFAPRWKVTEHLDLLSCPRMLSTEIRRLDWHTSTSALSRLPLQRTASCVSVWVSCSSSCKFASAILTLKQRTMIWMKL